MADPFASIVSTAVGEFPSVLLGGQHLAHPVRREREVLCVGQALHALAAPAHQVGSQDLPAEAQLRLAQ